MKKLLKIVIYTICFIAIGYTVFSVYMLNFFEADIKCIEVNDVVARHPSKEIQVVKNIAFCDDNRPINTKLIVEDLTSKEESLIYQAESPQHLKLAVVWRKDLVIDIYLKNNQVLRQEMLPNSSFQTQIKSH